MAADLTSSLSRLLTLYLQRRGFTCGMDDLLLKASAEKRRADLLRKAEMEALRASAEFVGHQLPPSLQSGDGSNVWARIVLRGFVVDSFFGSPRWLHALPTCTAQRLCACY